MLLKSSQPRLQSAFSIEAMPSQLSHTIGTVSLHHGSAATSPPHFSGARIQRSILSCREFCRNSARSGELQLTWQQVIATLPRQTRSSHVWRAGCGRDAVYLAFFSFRVLAVDYLPIQRRKIQQLTDMWSADSPMDIRRRYGAVFTCGIDLEQDQAHPDCALSGVLDAIRLHSPDSGTIGADLIVSHACLHLHAFD